MEKIEVPNNFLRHFGSMEEYMKLANMDPVADKQNLEKEALRPVAGKLKFGYKLLNT